MRRGSQGNTPQSRQIAASCKFLRRKVMNRSFALILAGAFLFASCAGLGSILKDTPQGTDTAGSLRGEIFDRSLEESHDEGYWVTRPANSTIIVLGIAGRRANKDEALAEALADAARRVALYHGVYGESAMVLNQGSGNLDYFSDSDYRLDLLNNAEGYIDALVFDEENDILEKDGAVFVRAKYAGISTFPVYQTTVKDGVPDWVGNYVLDIPGFLTAVAYSKNKGSLQKTFQASYENALVSLLPRLSSRHASEVIDMNGGGRMTQNISTNSGTLENVMILETWWDKKTGTVWTLLAARQKM
jgi:hypothetical protein